MICIDQQKYNTMELPTFLKSRRHIAINLVLFALLYLSVSFNKEYLRPAYGNLPVTGVLLGCFSNFIAAYIISLFPVAPIFSKKIGLKKARIIIYVVAAFVFLLLAIEELHPMWGASTTYDIYDILASGFGSLLAVVSFEMLVRIRNRKHYSASQTEEL